MARGAARISPKKAYLLGMHQARSGAYSDFWLMSKEL